jgi:hypothetical protein
MASYFPVKQVAFEDAEVFHDVISPILENKCNSCHNPGKKKGGLTLTDSAALAKGGKSGPLFDMTQPGSGLFIQRIQLPKDEKKHMPPAGRPQLSLDEISLLNSWVHAGEIYFSKKLIELPRKDSLRVLASAVFKGSVSPMANFDFPAADNAIVVKLNTDYRTIRPLSKESPGLEVNIYNAEAYSVDQLQQLEPIKQQIVKLDLNRLPVTNDQLKVISKFQNLRHLFLNFTKITASGLKELSPLRHLQTLAVSGTKMNYEELDAQVSNLKNLERVFIWDTGLSSREIERLLKKHKNIHLMEGFVDDGANPLRLNPPHLENDSIVFSSSSAVRLRHSIRDVQIRYTLDGTEPDSVRSPVFSQPLIIKENTIIKAKAFKRGWYGSDAITFSFLKSTIRPDSVRLLNSLNHVHQANGAKTFFDSKLGVIGANNPAWANNWAGVINSDLSVVAFFDDPVTVSSFGMRYMFEKETEILQPSSVQVWGGADENDLRLIATLRKAPPPRKGEKPSIKMLQGSWPPILVSCIKIIASPYKKGKNLLLIDEFMLN